MSLELRLLAYQGGGTRGDRIVRASFRGASHFSKSFEDRGEWSNIREVIAWPIASALHRSEDLEIQVLAFNRFLNNRLLGSTTFSLHRLIDEPTIQLSASLVDINGRPLKATINFELSYKCPTQGDEDCFHSEEDELDIGDEDDDDTAFVPPPALPPQFASTNLGYPNEPSDTLSPHHQRVEMRGDGLGGYSSGEDSRALLSLEQNIANLERSIKRSGGGGSTSKLNSIDNERTVQVRFAGRDKRRRGDYIDNNSDDVEAYQLSRSTSLNIGEGSGPKRKSPFHLPSTVKKRTSNLPNLSSLKNVRQAFRIRRKGSSSSVEDDERHLVSTKSISQNAGTSSAGGESSGCDDDFSPETMDGRLANGYGRLHGNESGDMDDENGALIPHLKAPPETFSTRDGKSINALDKKNKDKNQRKRPKPSSDPLTTSLKAQDFQICITIIEARQLAGLNMDPVVCVQVGDQKKYTSVKESTNCPYYNEYFVFDFHMAPLMLFDKIITLTVRSGQTLIQKGDMVGAFKLDIKTVYDQPDHQFYHKWALLTDPDDITGGPKGYLKCDINVITKGDAVKIPPKSERDEDDIEANLLLPDGVPAERQRAKYIVRIYRADGLPRMNSSIMANLKHAFGGLTKDLVDPYVQVSFAGLTGKTSVKKNSYKPVWNEQIVFTEMFPPLCQRIKIQLRESDTVGDTVIGTHFLDLSKISNDGDKGFIPTFGPAFIHLYGSTRDYSLIDEHSNLNAGLGEGVSYRGRLLIALKTDISDSIDTAPSEVEVEPTQTIHEQAYGRREEFFLFGCIMDATMIDKRLTDKPVQFEISMGNAGNTIDGQILSAPGPSSDSRRGSSSTAITQGQTKSDDTDANSIAQGFDDGSSDSLPGTWQSTTTPMKPLSHDRLYYFLPYWDEKPTVYIRSSFPDHRRRMYNSNAIQKVYDRVDELIKEVHDMIEMEEDGIDAKFKQIFEYIQHACAKYCTLCRSSSSGLSAPGKTRLDRERAKMCQGEMESISNLARQFKNNKKTSQKEKYKVAQGIHERLKNIGEDPQHGLPDVFLWLLSGTKRLAYQRINARHLLYSMTEEEKGKSCGNLQTLFLKLPGRKGTGPGGWMIQAKLQVYFWLGSIKHKKSYPSGLPPGFQVTNELLNAERPGLPPPISIHYAEKHFFQLRAHMYQARSLIGSDASGLSDPFARVICGEYCKTTQIIDETLSPVWDELLLFEEILVYGRREDIKANPPTVIIEIYDQDKVGKAEFLGRAIGKPHIQLCEDPYIVPKLEWFQIYRGSEEAGELLSAFEMFELSDNDSQDLPPFPDPREDKATAGGAAAGGETGPILPVPVGIRPTLATYRFEVLFWGLRGLKRIQWMTVDKPRVDVECAGHIIQSSVILNAKKNPNFSTTVKFLDIELPEQEMYCPPLTIRVVDCRSFGRFTLVGTHVINSIHKFLYKPSTKREKEANEKKKAQNILRLQQLRMPQGQLEIPGEKNGRMTQSMEMIPLISKSEAKDSLITLDYGTYAIPRAQAEREMNENLANVKGNQPAIKDSFGKKSSPKHDVVEDMDDDEESMDWWTKYFASVDAMIEICPEAEPWYDELIEATESGIGNPMQGIKSLSKSVRELSRIDEMSDITKSTSELLTGETFKKAAMKKRLKALGGKVEHKSVSQSTLIDSTDDVSLSEDVVKLRRSSSMKTSPEGRLARGENLEKKGVDEEEIKADSDMDTDLKVVKGKKRVGIKSGFQAARSAAKNLSPQLKRKKTKSSVALMKVYPNELEVQPEFEGFSEWLQTFELYRGKQADEIFDDESRMVGKFKGSIKIYKLPLPKDIDDHTIMGFDPQFGMFQGLPSNDPLHVLVRVYVIKANDLHPMDINGKADPYVVLNLGSKRTSDKDNYISKQLNPVFGKCFEFEATFPQDSILTIQVYDWDLLGSDDLIGETKIDLENRFYSRHRATCGIATRYDPCGYNQWRDPLKPVQLLTKLCKEGKVDGPHFTNGKVKVDGKTFTLSKGTVSSSSNGETSQKLMDEHLALAVLHHWHEIPRVGCPLVTEHIETRALYNPDKPGIEQGKLELWVDMFPMDMPLPGLAADVSARKPSSFELRVIIWNTDEVVLEDDALFTGEKMSDIYVKGWLQDPLEAQATDIHYRSLTGEGNFNWRYVFPFDYLAAEEKVVISKKESMFSWDETTSKVPARLNLQVWDADHFSKDDFLGAITLDLNRFPRGAKSAKLCSLDMVKTDGSIPMINLFKQKRTKGWWPLYIKTDDRSAEEEGGLVLQGKVEAELILMTGEEAEKSPAGLGRDEPDPLEKPQRPDSSFMWFMNPLKSIRYIIWHNYKWMILKILAFILLVLFICLFFYSIPGVAVQRMFGA